jgi:hypothetical protein
VIWMVGPMGKVLWVKLEVFPLQIREISMFKKGIYLVVWLAWRNQSHPGQEEGPEGDLE